MSKDVAEGPEKVGLINGERSGGSSKLRSHFTEKFISGTQMNGGFGSEQRRANKLALVLTEIIYGSA